MVALEAIKQLMRDRGWYFLYDPGDSVLHYNIQQCHDANRDGRDANL